MSQSNSKISESDFGSNSHFSESFHESQEATTCPMDSDSDSETSEPKLKYERLSTDLRTRILKEDAISCLAVNDRFLIIGTHWGKTLILDVNGNQIGNGQQATGEPAPLHSLMVGAVSIDHAGEYVASCSIDGKVIVKGLVSQEHNYSFSANKPVKAISIDPIFARSGTGRRFMTGDEKVILHEKSFLSRYKQTVLSDSTDGPVTCIKWRGRFVAWACSKGVRVYDVVEETKISLIKYDGEGEDNHEVPFRIAWSDQFHLFVAMKDIVKVCRIKKRTSQSSSLPNHMVEILYSFRLPSMWICGLGPFEKGNANPLVVLAVPKAKEEQGKAQRPELLILQPSSDSDTYVELATDLLSIKGYEKFKPKDYHLDYLLEDQHFFVVTPKDIVVGKPRDIDDHLDWLLDHEKYSLALDAVEKNSKLTRKHDRLNIGRKYLDYLLEDAQFDEAGKLCARLFGKNKQLWQDEVFKFARLNQLKILAPHLPKESSAQLEPQVYEMTLFELMKTDPEKFLYMIKIWPPSLYNVSAIVKPLVEQLLLNPENEGLQRALSTLYSYQGKYDKAMAILLNLGHEDVFELIRAHRLFEAVHDKIKHLMELNSDETLKLLLENTNQLSPELVVEKLADERKFLFEYLDKLVSHNYEESKKFHGEVVLLYADFAYPKLLPFLRSSDHYPIQEALEICRERYFIEEQIFILARMGNTAEALALITDNLVDIHRAVAFCKEHDDPDLWTDLIDRSLDKPYFVNVLLHNIGTHVDPRLLISKIENGQEIPGLRDSLVQIMQDFRLQVSLQQGCQKILISDCFSLLQKEVRLRDKGLAVHADTGCLVCGGHVVGDRQSGKEWIVFQCRHAFHVDCIGETNLCGLCNKNKS